MFKKLFKYDFKSTKRVGIPLLLGVLGLTVIGVIAVLVFVSAFKTSMYMPENADEALEITTTLSMVGAMLFLYGVILGLALVVTGMQIYCYIDFFKSTVSDEAYLTFTLPVKARDIVLSKSLCAFLWTAIQSVAVVAAVAIMLGVGAISGGEEFNALLEEIKLLGFSLGLETFAGDIVIGYVLNFIYIVVNLANTILLVYSAIFFVSTVMRKHRVIGAIGGVVIANAVIGGITSIVQFIVGLIAGAIGTIAQNPYIATNISSFVMIIIVGGMTVGLFFLLKYLMEKKLNLE